VPGGKAALKNKVRERAAPNQTRGKLLKRKKRGKRQGGVLGVSCEGGLVAPQEATMKGANKLLPFENQSKEKKKKGQVLGAPIQSQKGVQAGKKKRVLKTEKKKARLEKNNKSAPVTKTLVSAEKEGKRTQEAHQHKRSKGRATPFTTTHFKSGSPHKKENCNPTGKKKKKKRSTKGGERGEAKRSREDAGGGMQAKRREAPPGNN